MTMPEPIPQPDVRSVKELLSGCSADVEAIVQAAIHAELSRQSATIARLEEALGTAAADLTNISGGEMSPYLTERCLEAAKAARDAANRSQP